jgi:PncC family amidohydrolase
VPVYLLEKGSRHPGFLGRLRFYTGESSTESNDREGLSALLGRENSLEAVVLAAAESAGETITTAESCTGGSLGGALTEVPGSSSTYLGGVVSYSYEMKERLLGVPRAILDTRGAVSPECAAAMVEGGESTLGGSLGIAITGIAGPGGGTPTKPVGLVYMALRHRGETAVYEFHFSGNRREVRERSVEGALLLLLDACEGAARVVPEAIDGKRLTAG